MARDFNQFRNANAKLIFKNINTFGKRWAVQDYADGYSVIDVTVTDTTQDVKLYLEGSNDITVFPVASDVNKLCKQALTSFPKITTLYLFSPTLVDIAEETKNQGDYLDYLNSLTKIYVPSALLDRYKSTYSNLSTKFDIIIEDLTITIGWENNNTLTSEEITRQLNMLENAYLNQATKLVIDDRYTDYMDTLWAYNFTEKCSALNNNIWHGTDKVDLTSKTLSGSDELLESDIDNLISGISSDKLSGITQLKFSGFSDMSVALSYDYEDLPNLEYIWLDNARYDVNNLPRLPIGYQEVEYIETNGNQWINTNVTFLVNDSVYTKSLCKTTGNYKTLFGCDQFEVYYHIPYLAIFSSSSKSYNASVISGDTSNLAINTIYEHIFNIINAYNSSYKIILFDYTGTGQYTLNGKLYYFFVKRNNELVFDLIPCYRLSDNVIGLYDLANNVFYTNNGSGTFLKGNDIGNPTYFYPISDLVSEYNANLNQTFYLDYNGTLDTIESLFIWYSDTDCTISVLLQDLVVGTRYYTKATTFRGGTDFATDSWEMIKLSLWFNSNCPYQLGDTKTITYDNNTYTIRICDISARYDLSDGTGKNKATFEFVECLSTSYPMNTSNSNNGGWALSKMKTDTMPLIFNNLPSELKVVISQVSVASASDGSANGSGTLSYSNNYLFLPSEYEIFGGRTYSNSIEQSSQFQLYSANNNAAFRKKYKIGDTSPTSWWERSPYAGGSNNFCRVGSSGNGYYSYAIDSYGVAPFFCI